MNYEFKVSGTVVITAESRQDANEKALQMLANGYISNGWDTDFKLDSIEITRR